ncbi:unnamed protein product [Vicia faba]|uniref:Uncharacterized protein n=2 Tax=Vicia faba TaxID=3906 RepID=A0AAV0ZI90_VICFA|nr:unnamed protein product [Vicia faba]
MMMGEPLDHSGTRKIECLEEQGDAVWEIDRNAQTLKFTGHVRTTEGIRGLAVSSITHHITLELVLPMEQMIRALTLDSVGENSTSARHRGPRPRNRPSPRVRVHGPHVPQYDNAGAGENGFARNGRVESEEDPSEYLGDSSVNGDLPNGH